MADNTLDTKPMPMQDGTFFGEEPMFRLLDDLLSEGIVAAADLLVTASGTDVSVNVDAGNAYVEINSPYGGKRRVKKTASSNSGTPGAPNTPGWETTFATPDATNPRIDRVVLTVYDNLIDSSGKYAARLRVIQGAATAGASLTNLNGAAAVPNNSLLLANVLIRNGTASIIGSDVDSVSSNTVRPRALVGAGAALGGTAIATTIAGLGGGVSGKRGMLRLGSTPFDFIALTYDATLAKWVSEQHAVAFDSISNVSSGGADAVWAGHPGGVVIPNFKTIYDAGLRVQVQGGYRLTEASVASSIKARISEFTNNDTALNALGTSAALASTSTINQYEASSGWADLTITAPAEAHAFLNGIYVLGSNAGITNASISYRFVSA